MSSGENVGAAAPLLPTRKQHREGCPGCRLDEINKTKTGIPYLNFFYIWVVCLTASMPIRSLFPFLYFMIRDLKITKQEQDIGFYAGFVGATYFLGRTISAVPWGMFADKVVFNMLGIKFLLSLRGSMTLEVEGHEVWRSSTADRNIRPWWLRLAVAWMNL